MEPFTLPADDNTSVLLYRPLRMPGETGDAPPWATRSFAYVEGLPPGEGPAYDALSELARGGGRWLATVTPGGPWAAPPPDRLKGILSPSPVPDDQLPPRPPSDAYVVREALAAPILRPECYTGPEGAVGPAEESCEGVNAVEWWYEIQDARSLLLAPSVPPPVRICATVAAVRAETSLFSDAAWPDVEKLLLACEARARGEVGKDSYDFEGDDDFLATCDPGELLREGDVPGVERPRGATALEALTLLYDTAADFGSSPDTVEPSNRRASRRDRRCLTSRSPSDAATSRI